MHREKIPYLAENSCIARRFHTSQKCMHRKKISYLGEFMHCGKIFMPHRRSCIESQFMHCRKLMHHELIHHHEKISFFANFYASREDSIPRKSLHIARRFYTLRILCSARRSHPSQNFMHPEKISSLAKFEHRGKIFMPCKQSCTATKRIVHLKGNIYPSTSTDVNAEERN